METARPWIWYLSVQAHLHREFRLAFKRQQNRKHVLAACWKLENILAIFGKQ